MDKEIGAKKYKKKLLGIILFAALVALVLALIYYFPNNSREKKNFYLQEEVTSLTEKVSAHIILPENETPFIITINNRNELQNQAFFAGAKEGDKVLIYTGSRKAILYDPQADKIINATQLSFGVPTPETANSILPEIQTVEEQ